MIALNAPPRPDGNTQHLQQPAIIRVQRRIPYPHTGQNAVFARVLLALKPY